MRIISWVGRCAAIATCAGALQLAAPARADTATIGQYGLWSVVSDPNTDGSTICGVRTSMTDGGELRLIVVNNNIHLVAIDPAWSMHPKNEVNVTVAVDGDGFRGKAIVADPQTLVVPNLTWDFVREFMAGDEMEANLGGVKWTVSLNGSSYATSGMAACALHPGHGFMS